MRKFSSILIVFLMIQLSSNSFGQSITASTKGFNYQAVARDAAGNVIGNQQINVRVSVLSGSEKGDMLWQEVHSIKTNQLGLFNLVIGEQSKTNGTQSQFSSINWGKSENFLQVEIDAKGGNNFINMGISPIKPVPSAIHALTADKLTSGAPHSSIWYDGTERPDASLGNPNDYYLNTSNSDIYRKNDDNIWLYRGKMFTGQGLLNSNSDRIGSYWSATGDASTTPGTHFLGTTDNKDLVIKTNNTERMRVLAANGNVGLGTSTPTSMMTLEAENSYKASYHAKTYSSSNQFCQFAMFRARGTKAAQSAVLASDGLGSIEFCGHNGTALTSGKGSIQFNASENWTATANGTYFIVKTTPNGTTTSTEKLRVLHNGNVGIGTTTPSYKLHVSGTLKSNGITESSDIRWKKNIRPVGNALDKVLSLRGVNYEWKEEKLNDNNFENGVQLGLIAQEVEKVIPEVVNTDNSGYKSVQYSHLVALLIEAMKEQQKIIDSQKFTITSNREELQLLKAQVNSITNLLEKKGINNDKLSSNNK